MTNSVVQNYRKAKDANGLKVGQQAPDVQATDADGRTFQLSEELKKGPAVLIFYRGQWCPYCNKHLGEIQENLQQFMEKGATVVAVSPEKPEYLQKTALKTGARFSLLYDKDYQIADAYDVTFQPGSFSRIIYNAVLGAKLKEAHSDNSQQLPIPATYVIDRKGQIVWRHFDPDYKKRSTVDEIVRALELAK
ncbi:MAG: AhpC/TSA family protein [Prolixibacteraceae bacterium]|nr:AhpC/TSA family protein [Prolixibacteraceae bacterium]